MGTKATSNKISTGLSGTAGEYFTAAQLSRLGHIASINLKNTKDVDILVMNATGTRQVMIQVKTGQGSERRWMLTRKAESLKNDNLFYVFVNLIDLDSLPEFYIVPSTVVAEHVSTEHKKWLASPGRKGKAHMDNNIRNFRDHKGEYKDRWDILDL